MFKKDDNNSNTVLNYFLRQTRMSVGSQIDNLHVRLIFDLGKKKVNSSKELIKISKIAKFGYEML